MITFNIPVTLYELDELSEGARWSAIESHRQFLLNIMTPDDFISGDPEYDTPEQLREAYNSEYAYYEAADDPIVESIEANEYLFFEDGELAHTVKYVGGPKDGKAYFKTRSGKEYRIN